MINGTSGHGIFNQTQNAGTVINVVVPPKRNARTLITTILYLFAATVHTLTVLRSLGRTKCTTSVAAGGGATIQIAANPGPTGNLLAANDYVCIRETDQVTRAYKVSSISGLAVTLTGNLTTGVDSQSDLWMMGVAADTVPSTGLAHPQLPAGTANSTVTYTEANFGLIASTKPDEPLLAQSPNGTDAGKFTMISFGHVL